jgi:hypothetical protein
MTRDAVDPLLNPLNDISPAIKFTTELEKDASLTLLQTKRLSLTYHSLHLLFHEKTTGAAK